MSEQMPVIAEEDEDEEMTTKVIDLANEEQEEEEGLPPDDDKTNHDSEGEDFQGVAPDYDKDMEDKLDEETDSPEDTAPKATTNPYHTQESRKQANHLNAFMGQVSRSAAWRRYFARKAKEIDMKLLPLTPGYNVTRRNAEFDSLNQFVQARKPRSVNLRVQTYPEASSTRSTVLTTIGLCLKLRPRELARKKEHDSITNANEITVVSDPATSNSSNSGVKSVFNLFKSQDPEVARDEVTSYLKGTHPMAASDNARDCKAVLPWWSIHE
ncbi:uncharacterized protein MELLADRAFT_101759 [Melampsora larici-populina 98AG31]|uniref:Uncharacterized protein n=1 Tax=Melampsora larici-populina (strain 98AG31 / pathotype 3-4-7) TaxID=747676 RepID=F4R6V4_MELLP|nr:uncharacterized protein MELLADRAFT_101759 [Melampsora larici-populina 98AG31]EGG11936.1 hypothetical protein MELLADRAFT_101759 [Melampsora larici-populina 98AG31]